MGARNNMLGVIGEDLEFLVGLGTTDIREE